MNDLFPPALAGIKLRPDQIEAVEAVREHLRAGKKNILLCAPTGSGKGVIGAYLLAEADKKNKRAVFVVDRKVLTEQTSEILDRYGIDHGVFQSDHPRRQHWKRIQVCSAQTIARRKWPDADLIIHDECHAGSKVVADRLKPRDTVAIGLTATPFTRGLGKIYDALVNVTTTNKLIADGFLSPYKIFAAVEPDMTDVKIVAGEWDDAETSVRALKVIGDVVAEYLKHGEGRKFISNSVDVAHAEELARQFNSAGIRVEAYSYRTPDNQRAEIVAEFKKDDSRIRGLISPVALTRGFDVPSVSCVIMTRPLRNSLAEHIQFFGRGLRIHPKKLDGCRVLDHSGNSARFWDEWNAFFETGALELDDGRPKPKPKKKEGEEKAWKKCPQCGHLHAPRPICPVCGFKSAPKITVVHEAGTLKELIASGNRTKLTADVWPQICAHVRGRDMDGDKRRRMALALYKQITGAWPKGDFESTPSLPITAAVAGKLRQMQIAYSRRVRA